MMQSKRRETDACVRILVLSHHFFDAVLSVLKYLVLLIYNTEILLYVYVEA